VGARGPTERDYVRTIEAIYTVDRSQTDWLKGVLESSREWLDGGMGLFGYTWTIAHDGCVRFEQFVDPDKPPGVLATIASGVPPHIARLTGQLLRKTVCGLASDVLTPETKKVFFAPLQAIGIDDTLGINGRETATSGVWIGGHLKRSRALAPGEEKLYRRIARHLAAGNRLRRRLAGRCPTDADAAAILTPAGRLEHAIAVSAKTEARDALRAAVVAMDRARGAERHKDPEGAVGRWRVLADARFSLIDRFESDGRRFVVACENQPVTGAEARLTERERQIVALYRLGADSKLIAYELGLADATVRVLLSRAARRLGVRRPRALRPKDDAS